MKILVWGLGYVGTVVVGCLAKLGHEVVGIDPVAAKVAAIKAGKSPIKEPGLDELIQAGVANGKITAVTSGRELVQDADISLVCVGTPSAPDGSTGLKYIQAVATEIGDGLGRSDKYHVVVLRSTVFPGTTDKVLRPLLEQHSQKRSGEDFGVVMNPEFLRETTAIKDFYDPPYTVIGQYDRRAGDMVAHLYEGISGEIYRVSVETAELLKQTNNSFHALKVAFGNEIGRLCDRLELNSKELKDLVCADTKLNISPAYLRPGFAFGGSCLPKDLRSIVFHGQRLGVSLPVMEAILPSNTEHIEAARIKVHNLNVKTVTVLGLSFKANTDDLRESPMLELIRKLWQDGLNIRVYDPDVQLVTIMGSNLEYLERQLPQIKKICSSSLAEALQNTEAVVLAQERPEFQTALKKLPIGVEIIDLVRPHLNQLATAEVADYITGDVVTSMSA